MLVNQRASDLLLMQGEEGPVEGIWLQVEDLLRRFCYLCKRFAVVKRVFRFLFGRNFLNSPNLKSCDAFVRMVCTHYIFLL